MKSNSCVVILAVAKSAVNVSDGVLIGRPYGGTAIMYRKSLACNIISVDSFDPRVCAIKMMTSYGPVLFICVYMPYDNGDTECMENYIATCTHITALCEDCDVTQFVIAGDFNCENGSRFYNCLQNFAIGNKLCMSDSNRLSNVVTYCNDAGTAESWIDHVLCSPALDDLLCNVQVLEEFVSSDHKPLAVTFDGLVDLKPSNQHTDIEGRSNRDIMIDWSKADEMSILNYRLHLDNMLTQLNIPNTALIGSELSECVKYEIDDYYNSLMSTIFSACKMCLPMRRVQPMRDYVIPGGNDIVSDKHRLARDAYLAWAMTGKPRCGPEHWLMSRTRSQFKFALRYCKQHEDSVRSDLFASSLAVKDYRKFWNDIRKTNNKQSTLYVDCVNGCNGESDITDMWQRHYQQLYNSISDSEARETLLKRILDIGCGSGNVVITIHDVVEACSKQKSGKAVGLDGIAMEAFMHGGPRMHVHLCMLFNMFIRYGYIPSSFMKSVIIPLVKCKTGNLADVNNYRAIAISTAASKLLENVLSGYIRNDDHSDAYQFGFTSGCSTSLCTNVFKRTVDCYTHGGSHVFVSFLDFSRAFDKVSYWKLFHKLLDDNINVAFVKLLIFWYSNVCTLA